MELSGRRAAAAALLAAVMATSACTSGSGDGSPGATATDTPSASTTSSAPPEDQPPPDPTTPAGPPASTAPAVGATTLPPRPVGSAAPFGDGLVATVTELREVQVTAQGPGEVAGPAVAVTISLRNGTTARVDAGALVVALSYGEGEEAEQTTASPSDPAAGLVEPGASAEGTWVFSAPAGSASSAVVTITSQSSAAVVLVAA